MSNDEVLEIAFDTVMDLLQEQGMKEGSDIRAAEVWLSIRAEDWAIQADELPTIESFLDSILKTERPRIEAIFKDSLPPDDLRASHFPVNEVRSMILKAIKVER
jgi:hypothetical protein